MHMILLLFCMFIVCHLSPFEQKHGHDGDQCYNTHTNVFDKFSHAYLVVYVTYVASQDPEGAEAPSMRNNLVETCLQDELMCWFR